MLELDKKESSSWEFQSLTESFHYKKDDKEFSTFAIWVAQILQTRLFLDKANKFIELNQQIKTEPVGEKRTQLVAALWELKYG